MDTKEAISTMELLAKYLNASEQKKAEPKPEPKQKPVKVVNAANS